MRGYLDIEAETGIESKRVKGKENERERERDLHL